MFQIRRSYQGIGKLGFILGGVLIIFMALFKFKGTQLRIVAFILLGIFYYHIIMVVHELVHKTFVLNINVNEFLGNIIAPIVGLNFYLYRENHFRHHGAKNIAKDPDGYIYLPVLKQKSRAGRIVVFCAGSLAEFWTKLTMKSIGKKKQVWTSKYSVFLAQAGIFIIFLGLKKPLFYFLFWVAPIVTISLFLNRTRVLIEHGYGLQVNHAKNPQKTVNIRSNFVERLILAPNHFNYHQEHHDFPGIPYYQLQEFYQKRRAREKTEKVQCSYLALLGKILLGKG